MNKIPLMLLLLWGMTALSQELYVETGIISSSFDFTNSQGEQLDNLLPKANNYIAFGLRNPLFIDNLYGAIGARYAGYGAIGSDDEVGNFMEWDMNYLELNGEVDYQLLKIQDGFLYVKAGASLGFLIHGAQTINNRVINLKKVDEFNRTVLDTRIGLGFSYPIYRYLTCYIQYMMGKTWSPNTIISFGGDLEDLRIANNTVGIGFTIDFE